MDVNLRREIILDNYQNPLNKGKEYDSSYLKENSNNESCIDNINIMLKIEDRKIKDIVFNGEACAISTSATSIMIRSLLGKGVDEAKNILLNYQNMINGEDYDKELLGELMVYDEIYKQPNRKTCALLPEVAILKMLEENNENK